LNNNQDATIAVTCGAKTKAVAEAIPFTYVPTICSSEPTPAATASALNPLTTIVSRYVSAYFLTAIFTEN
jgi:hypothetical protein